MAVVGSVGSYPIKTLCELAYGKPFPECIQDIQNNNLSIVDFKAHCLIVSHLILFRLASSDIRSRNTERESYIRNLEWENVPVSARREVVMHVMRLSLSLQDDMLIIAFCRKMITADMSEPVQNRRDRDELLATLNLLHTRYPNLEANLAKHQEEPRRKDG
jgi:hypothetical protein